MEHHLPDLAGALINLGDRLSELGANERALHFSEQALEIYQQLAKTNSARYLPGLARALNSVAELRCRLGLWNLALTPAEQAMRIRQALIRGGRDHYLPNLIASLSSYALVCVNAKTDLPEALVAVSEAISLCERSAKRFPHAITDHVATAYTIKADVLDGLGRADEATAIRRRAQL